MINIIIALVLAMLIRAVIIPYGGTLPRGEGTFCEGANLWHGKNRNLKRRKK